MTKYQIFITYISPALTILIACLNIIFVYLVFKFNRKMGQSKLSVISSVKLHSSISEEEKQLHDKTYYLSYLSWVNNVKGLPRVTHKSTTSYGKKELVVTLNNKGELPSTNIKVTLIFKAYGTNLEKKYSGNDKEKINAEIKYFSSISPTLERKCIYSKKVVIKVPYIGAGENKTFWIVPILEQFRESELILVKIEANGHTYFKRKFLQRFSNPAIINYHRHPLMQNLKDPQSVNQLIGVDNYPNEIFVPTRYKDKGRGYSWLLKLFVGWRK